MSSSKIVLRNEAKKEYKEKTKKIPKKQRIPFSYFFKQYCESKETHKPEEKQEEFNIDEVVNVNKINE